MDYIHGSSTAMALASRPGQKAAAILLPDLAKADLFKGVVLGGVLPRKTFSMGPRRRKTLLQTNVVQSTDDKNGKDYGKTYPESRRPAPPPSPPRFRQRWGCRCSPAACG